MKIAIRGHESRGNEIIQIFKDLGTEGLMDHTGSHIDWVYLRDDSLRPNQLIVGTDVAFLKEYNYKVYTLEEFEKEFPFKIGDKVTIIGLPDFPKVITQMVWDCDEILYSFEDLNNTWFGAKSLKKVKMNEERNVTLTLSKAKEWYKKGGELREVALQAYSEKELNPRPRSWEEFCENNPIQDHEAFINYASSNITICKECAGSGLGVWKRKPEKDRCKCVSQKSAEAHLAMMQLEQLKNCWWNGWEPEWDTSHKYAIKNSKNALCVICACGISAFLVFPTMRMAEEFLECFRDLIEQAKDLI